MAFNVETRDVEIALPVKGVDRGNVRAKQPPGTVPDCRNIRVLDIRGRVGCGKRSGLAQAFDRAGNAGTRRVLALSRLTEAVGTTTSTGAYVDLTDTWTTPAVATPTDLGANWLCGTQTTNGMNLADTLFGVAAGPFLQFTGNGGIQMAFAIMCAFKTTNDVTMYSTALPAATFGGGGLGANNQCHGYGPFIRGQGRGQKMYGFRFRRIGAGADSGGQGGGTTTAGTAGGTDHIVVGELVQASGGVLTVLASTGPTGAILSNGAASTWHCRIYETSTGVTAEVSWPSEPTVGAFTLSATIAAELDLDGLPVSGGGVAFLGPRNGNGYAAVTRRVDSIALTKIVPQATEVAAQYLGTATPSPPPQAYFVQDGWTTFVRNVTASSTVATSVGYTESAASSEQWISRDLDRVVATQDTGTLKHCGIYRTTDTQRYGVEFRLTDNVASSDLRDSMTFFLRYATATSGPSTIHENLNIKVHAAGSASRSTTELVSCSGLTVAFQNGGASGSAGGTELSNTSVGEAFVFRADAWVRCIDSGAVLLITINGLPIYTLTSSTYGTNTRNGAAASYSGAATNPGGYGFRLFAIEDAVTRVGDVRSKILICCSNTCDIGILNNLGLTRCSGGGFANALPSLFAFNLKW